MSKPKGPRIIFKDDRDSSAGRGCVLYGAHFRPEVIAIVIATIETAPASLETVTFTEGWRDIRDRRDLHEEARAFDVKLNDIAKGLTACRVKGREWAARIRKRLGPAYDVHVHGKGWNLHVHIELDP